MKSFNLSALAVRERAVTLFLIVAVTLSGIYAFLHLGRAEDPSFTMKVMSISAVWPGATAQEMQDLVAEPLEKRLQELRYYDRVETFTRPGMALMAMTLKDTMPPSEVPEQFYQARKKLGDEAHNLPPGALGPFFNDEYSDVTFALYAVEAHGMPPRLLTREAEVLRQRLLHVPGVQKVSILGERPERIFVDFSYPRLATLGVQPGDIFAALQRQNAVTPAGSIETRGPQVFLRLDGAYDRHPADPRHAHRRGRPDAEAVRNRRCAARLRGPRHFPDPPQRRARHAAGRRHAGRAGTASTSAARWTPRRRGSPPACRPASASPKSATRR